MLPSELEEILKTQCWYANPLGCDMYGRRFNDAMHNFDKYKAFLDACGHDTQELAGAIARTKAAIQELKCVNESMTETFKKDPFPFTKVASDEARDVVNEQAEAEYEQAKAEYKQVQAKCLAEMDKKDPGIYYGDELEGAAPS